MRLFILPQHTGPTGQLVVDQRLLDSFELNKLGLTVPKKRLSPLEINTTLLFCFRWTSCLVLFISP